jgi:hypothetical protein
LVRVSEGTTDSFWETDLGSWFEKVLAGENIFWGKFTEVFLGSNFTWEEGRHAVPGSDGPTSAPYPDGAYIVSCTEYMDFVLFASMK